MLGRYQPWHEGHEALHVEASKRTEQVLIGVRNTHRTSEKDPLSFSEVEKHITNFRGNSFVVKMPNITNIVYGRDVGYLIEKVELGKEIESISATDKRKELGI
jgi:nicotinamide mononucleotide adenylyltransferase